MNIFVYGDSVNTDQLFPGKYTYTCATAEEIVPHLLEDLDPTFSRTAREGDIILAGRNFGCGSSREQPVLGLKAVGIQAVVARSFARIFYRSAINQGLLLVECPPAVDAYAPGKEVRLHPQEGTISVGSETFSFPPIPPEMEALRQAGGLLAHVRARLAAGS